MEKFVFRNRVDKLFHTISSPIISIPSGIELIEPRTKESTYPAVNTFTPITKGVDSSSKSGTPVSQFLLLKRHVISNGEILENSMSNEQAGQNQSKPVDKMER
ncbi:hypothetical protein HZH66_014650 [Vespula vulgaris]|uniref:Uncharacterized protein n=1 Tax=Vespula vulgaris TaxID=7454 RepID=A0A834MPG0_VESVU|nr:hypothetical protein HZH66_014650 [Vespula vulgaris]